MPVYLNHGEISAIELISSASPEEIDRLFNVLECEIEVTDSRQEIVQKVQKALNTTSSIAYDIISLYDGISAVDSDDVDLVIDSIKSLPPIADKKLDERAVDSLLRQFATRTESFNEWKKAGSVRRGLCPRLSVAELYVTSRPVFDLDQSKIVTFAVGGILRIEYTSKSGKSDEILLEINDDALSGLIKELQKAEGKLRTLRSKLEDSGIDILNRS